MPERSRDWYDQAARDLENARWEVQGGFYEWGCFVAQQAAEKALKGVYQRLGAEAWGHSVAALLEGLRGRLEIETELVDGARVLDRFYVPARYPDGWDCGAPKEYYTREDADDAIGRAERILRFCDGILARTG